MKKIVFHGFPIKVVSLNERNCCLSALLDTGSPISFVRADIYAKYFESSKPLKPTNITFRAVNNTPIAILGCHQAKIGLEQIPEVTLEIDLHVLTDNSLPTDIIIGRDFLNKHEVSVMFDPVVEFENNDFPEPLLQMIACSENGSDIDEITIDFDEQSKNQLKKLLIEIEKLPVEKPDDDYQVTVNLKDHSTYAYALHANSLGRSEIKLERSSTIFSSEELSKKVSPLIALALCQLKRKTARHAYVWISGR